MTYDKHPQSNNEKIRRKGIINEKYIDKDDPCKTTCFGSVEEFLHEVAYMQVLTEASK